MSIFLFLCKYTLYCVFFIGLSSSLRLVYAQNTVTENTESQVQNSTNSSHIPSEFIHLSGLALYQKAKEIKHDDLQQSILLANEALRKSKENNNLQLNAEIQILLGKLAKKSKNLQEAKNHFLQAALIYKNINEPGNEIMSSVEYAKVFFSEKRFDEIDKILNKLLPVALEYGKELPIAVIHMTKGDTYNKQKRYYAAINEYKKAVTYLSDKNSEVQKRLSLTYKKIGKAYTDLNESEKAIPFYEKSLAIYTQANNKKSIASILRSLATELRSQEDYITALDYSIRGLKVQRQLDNNEDLAMILSTTGMIYRSLDRYEKSLEHLQEAFLIYEKEGNADGIAATSNHIGLIYTRLKQFDQARSFYQVAIDLPEEELDVKTRAAAYREIAVIDMQAGDFDSAKEMAQKAYNIYKNENDKVKKSITARIIADIYQAQNNVLMAEDFYRTSLSLAIEIGNELYQVKALIPIAEILLTKDTEQAIILLKRALNLSSKMNAKTQELQIYRALKQARKYQGNIQKSLFYAEKEIELSNQINKEREESELVRAKATLDSHKMEMELSSLREKAQLDQLELEKKNNQIEIVSQASQIAELQLTKNKYANIALASLLAICSFMVLFIYRRFIDSRRLNKELDYLAARDPLTNCYNRRVLFDLMNGHFTDKGKPAQYCVIMADIDYFKAVNDNHGHSAGDRVLKGVANILQSGIRQNDITARFGGEEFCIVLPGVSKEQAMIISDNLRKRIESTEFEGLKVTCSFGVTSIEFQAESPTELIDQADVALYQSKSTGRNKVSLWSDQASS